MSASLRAPLCASLSRRPEPALLVGHGSTDRRGVTEFVAFTERMRRRLAAHDVDVDGGFIELSRPTVHTAWSNLVGRGHDRLVAVPLVLVAAGHAKGDIPAALAREVHRGAEVSYTMGRPLGPHPTLLTALAERVAAEVSDPGLTGPDLSDPDLSAVLAETAVLLVGRGSTDPDANAEVCKVARLLQEGRGFAFVEPAFVSLAWPGVPAGLERCRRLGARRVVVAPYFLFDGVLPRRVRAQAGVFDRAHGDLRVRVAGHIGDCDPLAELVVERYHEALHGDIRMNCDTCAYRVLLPGFADKLGAPQTPHHHPDDPAGPGPGSRPEHGHGHGDAHTG